MLLLYPPPHHPLFNSRRQKLCVPFGNLANLPTRSWRDAAPSQAFNRSRFVWISAEPPLCVFASQFPTSVRWSQIILSAESKVDLRDCMVGPTHTGEHRHTHTPQSIPLITLLSLPLSSLQRRGLGTVCVGGAGNSHSGSNSAALNDFGPIFFFYAILCR